jgi:heptosyltransferase II
MRNILVIRFSSLGDVILTGPIFQALRQSWPDARIIALTKESFADALRGNPHINECMVLGRDESLASLVQRVRRERFDTVVDLHSNLRSHVVALFSGADKVVRYHKAALARRLYVRWRLPSSELQSHTLDRYFRVLQELGIEAPIQKLLVIQTAFLGDSVLTLPFLKALKERYPHAAISVLCTPEVADVFEHHPAVSDLIHFDKRGKGKGFQGLRKVIQELHSRNYPLAFLPHRSFKSALIAWLAGIPRRIGFSSSQGKWLLTDVVPFDWKTHDADRNLALLQAVGVQRQSGELSLKVDVSAHQDITQRLQDAGISAKDSVLGINAGSVWPTKRWLPEGFAAVADRAIRELGMKVIFFGGPADAEAVHQVMGKMQEKAVDWVGKTRLRELIASIARCNVFLTNDSGPMHIAVASHVPTVAIFGPTTKELGFFPYGPGHIVVEKDLACRPCGLHGAKRCPLGHFQCMNTITPEEVFAAVVRQTKNEERNAVSAQGL